MKEYGVKIHIVKMEHGSPSEPLMRKKWHYLVIDISKLNIAKLQGCQILLTVPLF